jgi:tetratricopeptide (TPR) repeat protein
MDRGIMDNTTTTAIQKALELLQAGNKTEAQSILIPVIKQSPDSAEAWYLLGFTFTDPQKRLSSFQQVLRIDPSNQAAQKQIARLTATQSAMPAAGAAQDQPFYAQKPAAAVSAKPAPAVTGRKPVRSKRAFPIWIVVSAIGVLAVGGIIAIYILSGMSRNKQVNVLFSERKCAEVVQYASFANSFPKILFASLFGAYQQIEECQAKLALEQAVSSKDWSSAYAIIGNYLSAYPGGAFAAEMQAQVGDFLLSLAKDLVAKNNYDLAIQKLKSFQTAYPASPVVPVAQKALFDDYLLWAKYSFEQKSYQNAEKYFKIVSADAQASPEQAQQANKELAVVYLEWGKTEIESGAPDQGMQHYDDAKNLDPGLADYDRLKTQAKLLHATALAAKAKFDEALAEVKVILEEAQSEGSKADAADAQAKILDDYAHSKSEQAQTQMTAAALKVCKKELPELPIFGIDAENIRFVFVAPFAVEPLEGWLANTPAELHYVVCIDESQTTIQTCPYTGGHTLRRIRFNWALTLYDILTGKSIKSTKLQGSAPPVCAQRDTFYSGSNTKDVFGNRPLMQKVTDWLTTLKLTK